MKLNLNDVEIKEALRNYIDSLGIDTTGKSVTIRMVAGRGANGYSADVDIEQMQEPAKDDVKPPVKTKGCNRPEHKVAPGTVKATKPAEAIKEKEEPEAVKEAAPVASQSPMSTKPAKASIEDEYAAAMAQEEEDDGDMIAPLAEEAVAEKKDTQSLFNN